jgi:hypothetical protein
LFSDYVITKKRAETISKSVQQEDEDLMDYQLIRDMHTVRNGVVTVEKIDASGTTSSPYNVPNPLKSNQKHTYCYGNDMDQPNNPNRALLFNLKVSPVSQLHLDPLNSNVDNDNIGSMSQSPTTFLFVEPPYVKMKMKPMYYMMMIVLCTLLCHQKIDVSTQRLLLHSAYATSN